MSKAKECARNLSKLVMHGVKIYNVMMLSFGCVWEHRPDAMEYACNGCILWPSL
jgi:hypothetical protein